MKNPHKQNEANYEKARTHVEKGVTAMWKAGASLENIEYEVAAGLEQAKLGSVNVMIKVKER